LRVAVITPYYTEREDVLRQCHESVLAQSHAARHFMVADGHPSAAVAAWDVEHIILPRAHGDNGNTPRAIGSLSAISQDFDAIAYLDADNWFRWDHIARMAGLCAGGAVICTSNRTLHRLDGSLLYCDLTNDGEAHIDTSCIFLGRRAFRLVPLWSLMPRQLSPQCDRVFWLGCRGSNLPRAHSRETTVAFRTRYAAHYEYCRETPPPGAVTTKEINAPIGWWFAQNAEYRGDWLSYFQQGGW
jgi:hypothetical protein